MGITERREREKQEIRGKILDEARRLFASAGFENVTMRRIADAIEYSPTTIYHHFADKNALIQSLCHADMGRMLAVFADVPPHDDPVEMIRQIGLAYARFGLAHPHHYRFMFMTPVPPELNLPTADEKADHPGDRSFRVLVDAVERAVRAGRLRDEGVLNMSYLFWTGLHGVIALLITYQGDQFPVAAPPADLPERMIDGLLHAFRKEA